MTTLAHYEQLLTEVGEAYHVLPLQGGGSALMTRRGGRVLGLFPAPDAHNLFWTSRAFDSVESFRAFTTRTDGWSWNLGGDRCWIAPEITYNVRDRRDFGGTWNIPAAMDPGAYRLTADGQTVQLDQSLTLTGYHLGDTLGDISLEMSLCFQAAANPLARHAVMEQGLQYMGYSVSTSLQAQAAAAGLFAEIWNLTQLNAGGTLLIPVIGEVQASDYVTPVPEFARQPRDGVLHLPLNGKAQFKIGYQSLCMTGRMGYLHESADGQAYLLVRSFHNDPSNLYAEEPPAALGVTGHSVHVYNDGGTADNGRPFCEMECNGHTLGAFDGLERWNTRDTFSLWAYVGAPEAVSSAARALLGSAT